MLERKRKKGEKGREENEEKAMERWGGSDRNDRAYYFDPGVFGQGVVVVGVLVAARSRRDRAVDHH